VNRMRLRSFAREASSARFFGVAFVVSERRNVVETRVTSSTAARNGSSFAFDGLLNPLIFLTNWSEAARTSSSETGGSKLKSVLIFLHIFSSDQEACFAPTSLITVPVLAFTNAA